MISPLPDEMLQSFMFRSLACHGYFNACERLVSKFGWNLEPRLPDNCGWLFDRIRHPDLVQVYGKLLGEHYVGSVIDSPLLYIKNLRNILFNDDGKNNTFRSTADIKYCKQCFAEQLEEFGFLYFKQGWLLNNTCQVHQTPLYVFSPPPRARVLDFVLSPLAYLEKHKSYEKVLENDSFTLRHSYKPNDKEFYLARCAKHSMTNNFRMMYSTYNRDFSAVGSLQKYQTAKSLSRYSLGPHKLESKFDEVFLRYFERMKEVMPETLEGHISRTTEPVKLIYEDDQLGCYSKKMLKDKRTYCEICDYCFRVARILNPESTLEIVEN